MIQMQITLPENTMEMIRAEAAQCSVSPNIFTRIKLCTLFRGNEASAEKKSYIVTLENSVEIEAYVKERGFGDMSFFVNQAIKAYTKKNHLSAAQKAAVDRNIEKQNKVRAEASA